jgi:hypothetical protein
MTSGLPDDDVKVFLLIGIRTIFNEASVDRMFTILLLEKLYASPESMWAEWTGENDDKPPHPLTDKELSNLLRPFNIKPGTIHPLGTRNNRGPSGRGYKREWFLHA